MNPPARPIVRPRTCTKKTRKKPTNREAEPKHPPKKKTVWSRKCTPLRTSLKKTPPEHLQTLPNALEGQWGSGAVPSHAEAAGPAGRRSQLSPWHVPHGLDLYELCFPFSTVEDVPHFSKETNESGFNTQKCRTAVFMLLPKVA